jgi:type I restriction enzyme, S subunit
MGMDISYQRLTTLRTNDFVYPKLMAWEGALSIVPPECDGCAVSPEFRVFNIVEDRVLPEVIDIYFRTPSVWPNISRSSPGTNVRRRRLNPETFLNYVMPLPSKTVQDLLRSIRKKYEAARPDREGVTSALGALLPAILDRAFHGDL